MDPIPSAESVEQGFEDDHNDYSEHQYDASQESQFDSGQFGSYPQQGTKDSIYTFFRQILTLVGENLMKVGNLDKRELGNLDLSVRNNAQLSQLGTLLHNKSYHDYFMGRADIILATSMSKKGWLPELVISQKKFTQRTVQPMSIQQQQKKPFLGIGGKSTAQQPQ